MTRPDLAADILALERRVTRGPGTVPTAEREAAFAGETPAGPLGNYLDKVRYAAITVSDEEVAELRAAGYSDDALFELTIAAALGAAKQRLDAGLAAIDVAYGEG